MNSTYSKVMAILTAIFIIYIFLTVDDVRKGVSKRSFSRALVYSSQGPCSENVTSIEETLILVLAYFNEDLVRASLDSIIAGSSGEHAKVDVVVIEQQSKHSQSINNTVSARKTKHPAGKGGILHYFHVMEDLPMFGELFKVPFVHGVVNVSNYKTTCLTDGDVIMYGDWLSEIRFILETHPDVALAAVSLNPINIGDPGWIVYGPVHDHYIEAPTGLQMVCFRANHFSDFLTDNIEFRDHLMQYEASKRGKVVRTRRNNLIHMMWSVYAEQNGAHAEYLKVKEEVKKKRRLWGRNKNATDANFIKLF